MRFPMTQTSRWLKPVARATANLAIATCFIAHAALCTAAPSPQNASTAASGKPELGQLLISSPWCFSRQNKSTGYSYNTRFRFAKNGTYVQEIRSEAPASNVVGGKQAKPETVRTTGRWAVRNGQLTIASGKSEMKPVNLTVKRNVSGAPMIGADNMDYTECP